MPRSSSATLGLVGCFLGATAFGFFAVQGLLSGKVRPALKGSGKGDIIKAAEPLRYWIAISTHAAVATVLTLYGRRLLLPPTDSAKRSRPRGRR